MREEGGGREGARKQVRGKSRQRVQEETAAVTGSEVGSVNSKSQTSLKVVSTFLFRSCCSFTYVEHL